MTITSALMTVSVAGIVTVSKEFYQCIFPDGISVLLAIIPIMIIAISLIGMLNLRREYCRFLDWVTISDKLQEKIGLYQETSFKKYPEDRCEYDEPDRLGR